MTITFRPAIDFGLEPTATLLTEGFSGYFVPLQISPAGLLLMIRQDNVDLTLSRILLDQDVPVGAAMIARRGWTARLAAMSIVPSARGKGIGALVMQQLLAEARARGERAMLLEVIEQNTPAVRLYSKSGFQTDCRLIGFSGQPEGTADTALEPVDIREVARMLITHGPADLPWQLAGETLAPVGPPSLAYRLGDSYIALSNPGAPDITIRTLVTLPQARHQGSAARLLRAVFAAHPNKTWRVPAILPEHLGGLFEKIGLQRQELTQLQMSMPLF